ncbi:MAG: DnaJ-domain-containing protein [Amphiamblys sp. WSBS2006]|nr:MAG: DnaJ-domain-containing protein [Amphiamblys sp. WSBS2006]
MGAEQRGQILSFLKHGERDPYAVLGVERSADDAEIKRAYRKLSLLFHPDKNHEKGASECFVRVGKAFNAISTAEKRRKHGAHSSFSGTQRPSEEAEGDMAPEQFFWELFRAFGEDGFSEGHQRKFSFDINRNPFHTYTFGRQQRRHEVRGGASLLRGLLFTFLFAVLRHAVSRALSAVFGV